MVPEKARLKRAIFTITGFPVSVVLKADGNGVVSLPVDCGTCGDSTIAFQASSLLE
jgi:hypothetical protein